MDISYEEIKKLVELSALEYSEDEYEALAKDFSGIVDFVEQLVAVDIPEEKDTNRLLSVDDLREDVVVEPMPQAEILYNAPEKSDEAFIVPKVVE